jgi:hypothetical protein
MATWALFDQSKRWIASSQDENGAEYYTVNNSGNTVTYGLLRKTLLVEELLEQYPGTAYIVLSTNNHADYEAKMDINNVNFGWSSEKQYITLRSVASGPETDIPQNVNYGAENAGKLLYVGSDGFAMVLALGAGLAIENGVLILTGNSQGILVTDDGEGNVTVSNGTVTDDGNGNVTVTGVTVTDDGNGNVSVA